MTLFLPLPLPSPLIRQKMFQINVPLIQINAPKIAKITQFLLVTTFLNVLKSSMADVKLGLAVLSSLRSFAIEEGLLRKWWSIERRLLFDVHQRTWKSDVLKTTSTKNTSFCHYILCNVVCKFQKVLTIKSSIILHPFALT